MVPVHEREGGAVHRRRERKEKEGESEENRNLKHVVGVVGFVPLHHPPHQLCNVMCR